MKATVTKGNGGGEIAAIEDIMKRTAIEIEF